MVIDHIRFMLNSPIIGPDMYLTHWLLFFKPLRIAFQKRKLFHIGEGSEIRPYVRMNGTDSISIGRNVTIQPYCVLSAHPHDPDNGIVIEDNVLFAPKVTVYSHTHTFDDIHVPIKNQPYKVKKTIIREGAWLGVNSVILPGVTVGKNSVVGAGSIVTKDVPDYCVVGGAPARVLKTMQKMNKVVIIAEAGVNHNGSLEMALKLIDVAVAAGADAVKFQTFKAEKSVTANAPKANYQKDTTGSDESQLEMVKKLELDETAHIHLYQYCKRKGIQFLSTPFDLESIDLLNRLGLEIFKIPSGEITNLPSLRKIGSLKKRLILSTGMADLAEIEDALNVLTEAGTPLANITVLHCNTEYPTPFEDVNLRAMLTIGHAFGVAVGYSDHTTGIEVAAAAVAMGAVVLEKHFTLDRNLPGPDHKASLEPDELKAMVQAIRNIEKALGDGIKRPSPSEVKNKSVVRKSIVAATSIRKGETFTLENLTIKRPGTGINPMLWNELIGKPADRNYVADEVIEL